MFARTRRILLALGLATLPALSAHAINTNWTDSIGGSFTDSRNWDNGVPGSDDLAVFRRGNVAYTVTFVDPFPPPIGSAVHPEINRLIIGTNTVTFFSLVPSTLRIDDFALLGGDTIIGQTGSDVAVLNMNLASLSTLYATLGNLSGASGTLNINTARTFNVTGTGAAYDLIVGAGGTGVINLSGGGDVTVADDTMLGRDTTGVGNVSVSGSGTTWTNTGDLIVGGSGNGTLMVDAVAEVINNIGYIGQSAGSTGSATIAGANTAWRNLAGLYVGYSGNATLNVTSGADLINAATTFIGYNAGSTGVANVSTVGGGNLTRMVQNNELFVGYSGTGTFNITDGGYVQNTNAYIGQNALGDGTVTVSGVNSEWNNFTGVLTVGNAGSGTLNVAAGGVVKNTTGIIADDAGSVGEVFVNGITSTWMNNSNLLVGNLGQGTLTIQNFGLVSVVGATTINSLSSINLAGGTLQTGSLSSFDRINWSAGNLHLTAIDVRVETASIFHNALTIGPNRTLTASKTDGHHTVSDVGGAMLTINGGKLAVTVGTLNIGDQTGANGSLEVINGGQLEIRELYVARESGSSGSVRIRGPQSGWIGATIGATSTFDVGFRGDGVFEILEGGRVQFSMSGRSYVGRKDGATGLLRVDGAGSELTMSLTPLAIGGDINETVGGGGTGRVEVTSGGHLDTAMSHIGYGNASTGTVLVSGPGSTWNNSLLLALGNATFPVVTTYSHASLTVMSGGTVTADAMNVAGLGGEATVIVDGTGSTLTAANDINVAGNAPGNPSGGYGVFRIINGADAMSGAAAIAGDVEVRGAGSSWKISGNLAVTGGGGNGAQLEVMDGSRLESRTGSIGQGAVTPSVVLVSGAGSVWENALELRLGQANQYRGVLEIANGARVEVGSASLGYSPEAVGTAMISGTDSLWDIQGELRVGGNVANRGFIYVADGGELRSEEAFIGTKSLLQDLNSSVEVDGSGSAWINEVDIHVGYSNSVGSVAVTNGGLVQSADIFVESLGEIRGNGTIVADVQNSGLVSPGTSPGALRINGEYSQNAAGKLSIELASQTSFDQLLVTGEATLGGTLSVALVDSFMPSVGNLFEVLHADAGILNQFVTTTLPSLGTNLEWNVIYSNFGVLLEVVSTLTGDFNADGKVDAADYVVWRKNDGTQDGYDTWRANFGRTGGSGSGATGSASAQLPVPEPSGLLLCCIACVAIVGVARRAARCEALSASMRHSGRNQPPWLSE